MNSSINMDRLIQNLDNKLENSNGNSYTDTTYSNINNINNNINNINSNINSKKEKQVKQIEVKEIKELNREKSIIFLIKKYLIIYILYVLLSHPEFDKITNIESMPLIYRIMIKALIMIVIQLILSSIL